MLTAWTDYVYNHIGKIIKKYDSRTNGLVYEADYNSKGQLAWEIGEDGVKVVYTYDDFGRIASRKIESASIAAPVTVSNPASPSNLNVPESIISYTYDAKGRVLTESKTNGSEALISTRSYWESGLLKEIVNFNGVGAKYEYNLPWGGYGYSVDEYAIDVFGNVDSDSLVRKHYYRDGQLGYKTSCSGCGYVTEAYKTVFGVMLSKEWTSIGDYSYNVRYSVIEKDGLGNVTKTRSSGWNGEKIVDFEYDSQTGQLSTVTEMGLDPIRYAYNPMGELSMEWVDLGGDNNLAMSKASDDAITLYDRKYFQRSAAEGGGAWLSNEVKVYSVDLFGNGVDTLKTISRYDELVGGFYSGLMAQSITWDASGNITRSKTIVDRATKTVSNEIDHTGVNTPANTATSFNPDETVISLNGVTVFTEKLDGSFNIAIYDDLLRITQRYDSVNGYQKLKYYPNTSLVEAQSDFNDIPSSLWYTEFEYDEFNRMNAEFRVITEYSPGDYGYSVYRTEYDSFGRVVKEWGDRSPVQYEYDNTYGHLWKQHTYRGSAQWYAPSWPSNPGTADTAEYVVDDASGLLENKISADSTFTSYIYTNRGDLKRMTNARGGSSFIEYTYDYEVSGIDNVGRIVNIDDGSTSNTGGTPGWKTYAPDIQYTYNRFGDIRTVSDVTGVRAFKFDPNHLQISEEQLSNGFYDNWKLTRDSWLNTDSGYGNGYYEGKAKNVKVFNGSNGIEVQKYYYYDSLGRVEYVRRSDSGNAYETEYGYESGTSYVNKRWTHDTVKENRDRRSNSSQIETVETVLKMNSSSSSTLVKHHYLFDDLTNRRVSEFKEGSVFSAYGSGSGLVRHYSYNTRQELSSAIDYHYDGSGYSISAGGAEVTDRRYGYHYDSQGNRSGNNGLSIGNTGYPLFTVNYFTNEVNEYTLFDYNSGLDVYPIHDADGNLTEDADWWYVYNGFNQLTEMYSKYPMTQNGKSIVLLFEYDYLGRRVKKEVWHHQNWSYDPSPAVRQKFIYDGNNVMAMRHTEGGQTNTVGYIWGLDINGGVGTSGGVGGLLLIEDSRDSKIYSVAQDGNGNITAVVDLDAKSIVAGFEYSAFGVALNSWGSYADKMPFRFSSKWCDLESGLYYYGLRYYQPSSGRFINRDPIGEFGGINLYGFVGNDPVNRWDYMGLYSFSEFFQDIGNVFSDIGSWIGTNIIDPVVSVFSVDTASSINYEAVKSDRFLEGEDSSDYLNDGEAIELDPLYVKTTLADSDYAGFTDTMDYRLSNRETPYFVWNGTQERQREGGLIVKDKEGVEIYRHWIEGSGEDFIRRNGSWGEYMRKNALLEERIYGLLKVDVATRSQSGFFNITSSAEIQNGYSTGYEMLHGTSATVGGFNISGFAYVDGGNIHYSATMTWNDVIDPNPRYILDTLASGIDHMLYDPKDYVIRISWDNNFMIYR